MVQNGGSCTSGPAALILRHSQEVSVWQHQLTIYVHEEENQIENRPKVFISARMFVCITLILGITGVMNAQLVTNGSFESSNPGVVSGTDARGWATQGKTNLILDNLIAAGKAKGVLDFGAAFQCISHQQILLENDKAHVASRCA